jgi:dephospho-CoA kinase
MVVVVLTGGIGSGKSAAAEYFLGRGASVIDLDEVAARAMVRGSAVLGSVVAEFGDDVLESDGSLDRTALARACFDDEAATRRLDAIVHPVVAAETALMLSELRQLAEPPGVVVIEVPLLAEAPEFAEGGDLVVAISAAEDLRVERATARGMSRPDVMRRVRVQAPDSAREALADVVIRNDGTVDELIHALDLLWEQRIVHGDSGG